MYKEEIYIDKISGEELIKEIFANGNTYYKNSKNQCHRLDGPAYEFSTGTKYWYQNGERHRTDGPAVEYFDGTKEWWINGRNYTELEFNIYMRKLKIENL